MPLSVAKGTFVLPTTANSAFDAVTGLSFQPKAVLFFSSGQNTNGFTTNAPSMIGMATGSATANQGVVSGFSNEFEGPTTTTRAATANTGRSVRQGACIVSLSAGSPTVDAVASFVQFNADGFRLNVSDAASSSGTVVNSPLIHYLALGGTDLTNAVVGMHTVVRTTIGTEATTGLGFMPDAVFFLSGFNIANPTSTGDPVALGTAVRGSPNTQGTVTWVDQDGATAMTCLSQNGNDSCIVIPGQTAVIDGWASISSFDAGGFTLNWQDPVGGTGRTFFYLAMKGPQFKVARHNQPATGSVPYTGVGFQPKGLLFFGIDMTTDNAAITTTGNHGFTIGASDGTNDGAICNSQQDGNADSYAHRGHSNAHVMRFVKGTTVTEAGSADLTATGADGFTLNWTASDSIARRWFYLAMGDAGAAAPDTPIRRRLANREAVHRRSRW